MARYNLPKVPLNTKQTNKQTNKQIMSRGLMATAAGYAGRPSDGIYANVQMYGVFVYV